MKEFKFRLNEGDLDVRYESDFKGEDTYKIKINAGLNNKHEVREGIWVLINPEDYEDYKNDERDQEYRRVALLLNTSIYGPAWGSAILYKLKGVEMPMSNYDEYSKRPGDLEDCSDILSRIF